MIISGGNIKNMLAIIFVLIYLGLHVLLCMDTYYWIKAFRNPFKRIVVKIIFFVIFAALTSLILVNFFLPSGELKRLLSRGMNYYQGFIINLMMVLVIVHFAALVLKIFKVIPKGFFSFNRRKAIAGICCIVISLGFSAYGFINANIIRTTSYNVNIDKKGEDMKIVLVSDLHLGYSIGVRNIRDMAEKINRLDADVVCIAGDIFDNDYDSLDNPEGIKDAFLSIKSRYGVYACWGNHDVEEKLIGGFPSGLGGVKKQDQRMRELLEQSGVILLEDEAITVENKFTLIGRLDKEQPGNDSGSRLDISEIDFNKNLPVICMDHQPSELKEKADAGIDIDLGGHTHNGQFFPLNLGIGLMWENPAGYMKVDGENNHVMHNIVTEGIGVYGPFMRTFTKAEIVEVNVTFAKQTGN